VHYVCDLGRLPIVVRLALLHVMLDILGRTPCTAEW
jgi:hypothetical protein